jgi:hypothetical protein
LSFGSTVQINGSTSVSVQPIPSQSSNEYPAIEGQKCGARLVLELVLRPRRRSGKRAALSFFTLEFDINNLIEVLDRVPIQSLAMAGQKKDRPPGQVIVTQVVALQWPITNPHALKIVT